MAAIGCRPLPPPSSLLGRSPRRPKRPHLLPLPAGGRQRLPPRLRVRAPQAAVGSAAALQLAFDAPATAGDLSVLIPISTVLLIVYWVANFVVPEMIAKDLQRDQPDEDILEESDAKVDEKAATPTKPAGQSNTSRGVKGSSR